MQSVRRESCCAAVQMSTLIGEFSSWQGRVDGKMSRDAYSMTLAGLMAVYRISDCTACKMRNRFDRLNGLARELPEVRIAGV